MSVWLCIPSARPVAELNRRLEKWRRQGYLIAMVRNDLEQADSIDYNIALSAKAEWGCYPGYAVAVNRLIAFVMGIDRGAEWFVTGGDDVDPDLSNTADKIATQASSFFHNLWTHRLAVDPVMLSPVSSHQAFTLGVVQPTGDRWGDRQGAYIDRVAGSPWIGREFARRMYQGKGPYWPGYTHMGVDEELQAVATKYSCFQQRPDLIHYHDHWGRARAGEVLGQQSRMPAFLEHANSAAEWNKYKALFKQREAHGFPGSEPIA